MNRHIIHSSLHLFGSEGIETDTTNDYIKFLSGRGTDLVLFLHDEDAAHALADAANKVAATMQGRREIAEIAASHLAAAANTSPERGAGA